MVHYRRNRLPGASYFFTVTLADRQASTLTDHIALLGDSMRTVQQQLPFTTDAIVVLPEHLHCVWTLPETDSDYPARWKAVKAGFTKGLRLAGVALQSRPDGGFDLWQRRYWEHTLRDEADVARHIDYIHYNPVKHGWVTRAVDWPHSSFHRYVRMGVYPEDWGIAADIDGAFGEP
ncbi:MAG: transposase [Burkholderiaceae bacterium]|nr:transposase [Burkholderiaceae bacterium]